MHAHVQQLGSDNAAAAAPHRMLPSKRVQNALGQVEERDAAHQKVAKSAGRGAEGAGKRLRPRECLTLCSDAKKN